MQTPLKRLFLGVEVHAPWPIKWPQGRLLREEQRHLTLAFFGAISEAPLLQLLSDCPGLPMSLGEVGYFECCLMLPSQEPRVVAWQARFFDQKARLITFQTRLCAWLRAHGYALRERGWLPHVTLCRRPFQIVEWQKSFIRIPLYTGPLHLYESMGELTYRSVWSAPTTLPFEEIDHTADIAFIIRGETLSQLYVHAFVALAFKAPRLLDVWVPKPVLEGLDDLVIALNHMISALDTAGGCSLKAVSFHGDLVTFSSLGSPLLQWEMIVDV